MGSCTSENATIREYSLGFANKQDPALDRPFAPGASLGEIYGSTGVPSGSPRPRLKEGPRAQSSVLSGSGHGLPLRALPRALPLSGALASCVSLLVYLLCLRSLLAGLELGAPVCKATYIPGSLLSQENLAKGAFY